MAKYQKYDFTQHFITCGKWKKIFDGIGRQITQAWGVENVSVEKTEILHFGTVKRLFVNHTHGNNLAFSYENGELLCTILRDVEAPNKKLKSACCEVLCNHFPLNHSTSTKKGELQGKTLCFCLKFSIRNSFFLLLIPCKPFKQWEEVLETFSYTSNCKADLSKDLLNAKHVDLQKLEMEIKPHLQLTIPIERLAVGKVLTTEHHIGAPIQVAINGNQTIYGTIGQSGEKKCVVLHKETVI